MELTDVDVLQLVRDWIREVRMRVSAGQGFPEDHASFWTAPPPLERYRRDGREAHISRRLGGRRMLLAVH